MSIAASEGELEYEDGHEDPAVLPPSGKEALIESDPELTAMLSRAAESVGLEWRPPLCPKAQGWMIGFLGWLTLTISAPPQCMMRLPDRGWHLSARNQAGASSPLTILDGGAAKGYVEIPPVECVVVMQSCPQRTAA